MRMRSRLSIRLLCLPSLALGVLLMAQAAAAQSQPADNGSRWRTIVYPVRLWAPVFGADVRLPEVPGDPESGTEPTVPTADVSSNFNGAAAAGFRIERRRLSVDGSFLWAGMSGSVTTPNARLDVDTIAGRLLGGVRVLPGLFIDGGVRRLALKMTASVLAFPTESWKPGIWEPVVGITYRPQFGNTLRILAQGNAGGLGQSDHRTYELTATLEWIPFAHFTMGGGYGLLRVRADGTLRNKPVHLRQTLQGPIVTLGIPF